ncbi:DnaJ 2 [Zea mays]|uniref:DnaJ 2 n=2 Tax=Zea mays TaxID=4577 RepID=A0A3L6FSJ8_MAIZE|nr:Chaperone protein dnaJ 3 [Zea mays]PWZ37706.1 DnaJ 2 [Zea mays]
MRRLEFAFLFKVSTPPRRSGGRRRSMIGRSETHKRWLRRELGITKDVTSLVQIIKFVQLHAHLNGGAESFLNVKSCKGSKSGASSRCAGCQGSGFKVQIRQLGPGMIQQMQHPCNECKGSGETISDKDTCPQCKGDKVVSEKKVLEVVVEKGMQNGQKITFPGEADEAVMTPYLILPLEISSLFSSRRSIPSSRKGDDLFYEHTLTLIESLCGFQFVLTHLDNRQLLIKPNPGEVVKPDSFKAINDEGMPMYQRPFMKGKLYIHFSVEFPDSLSLEQCKALEAVLPPKPISQYTDMELDECEETMPYDVNIEEEMQRRRQHQEAYDEDDDVPGGGQRVQCAQQ